MAVAVRQALQRMGLSLEAAQYAVGPMNLNSLAAWRDFHTDDDLDGLAKNPRSPGGTINQGGQQVRHPGFAVSVRTISNLKVMRLALKHHQHIQRTVTAANVTLAWLADWEFLVDFHKLVSKKKATDDDLPKIIMSDWAKTKDNLVNHFNEVFGVEGIPLSYLLRDESEVPPEADDPHADYEDDHIKELIARASHETAIYRADNRTLCRLLKKICKDTPSYTYVSKYQVDGRAAWQALIAAYLGPQHTQNQAAIYEAKILNATYRGESGRWDFEKYVTLHLTAHEHLESLVRYGYKMMDEGTKVRHLLKGVKTDKLKTVVEVVRGNKDYDTFETVSRRIKDYIVNDKSAQAAEGKPPGRQASAVKVVGRNGSEVFTDIDPDTSMEDKYYPPKEWAKLSSAQKKGVLLKRQQRGGSKQPASKNGGASAGTKRLSKKISKLEKKIAALTVDIDDGDSGAESGEEPPPKKKKGGGNRGHPALNRA